MKLFDDEAIKTFKEQEKKSPVWLFRLVLLGFGFTFILIVYLGGYVTRLIYEAIAQPQTLTTDNSLDLSPDEWHMSFPLPFDESYGPLVIDESVIRDAEFSFSIWFKTNEDRYAQVILGNYLPCSYSDDGFSLIYYGTTTDGGARLELLNGGGTDFVQRFGVLSDNQWHHVTGVFAVQRMDFYLDGELIGTLNKAYTPTTVALQVGAASEAQPDCAYGNTNYFRGEMADLRIYQYPLNETDIQALFQEKP